LVARFDLSFLRAAAQLLQRGTWVILDTMIGARPALLVALTGMLGCATAGSGAAAAGPPPEDAHAYYPFSTGWKWAYDVEREGQTMLATTAVIERRGDTAIVQAGDQRLSYELSGQGIARREGLRTSDFLLHNPIRAGATWPIEGGQAKVAEVGKTVTVPGGTFPNCATIEESRTDPNRITRTVYCANVGPVSIDLQIHDPLSGAYKTEMRATLLGLTRPGEDPLGMPEGSSRLTP
jgi:hypothetical protein